MSPILGIWASSIQGSQSTSFDSIATVTVGAGGSSSIDFTSIPSTYKHLQIRGIARATTGTAGANNLGIRFNSDTGTNYARHGLIGTGSTTIANGESSVSAGYGGRNAIPRNGITASVFGVAIIDILDYALTSKYKTVRSLAGLDDNSTNGSVGISSGLWLNTNAITSISLFDVDGGLNFTQYSTFALYGIK